VEGAGPMLSHAATENWPLPALQQKEIARTC
jgi:hypothetical protein